MLSEDQCEDIAERLGALRNLSSAIHDVARRQVEERLLFTDLPLLLADVDKLTAELAELYSAIGFETKCLNCSSLLDASYAETVRAEKAETALAEALAEVERLRGDAEWLNSQLATVGEVAKSNKRAAESYAQEVERLKVQASNYAYQRDEARRERDSLARRCSVRFGEAEEARAEASQARDELAEATAAAARLRPLIEPLREWRAMWHPDSTPFPQERALIAAVDALDVTTPDKIEPDSDVELRSLRATKRQYAVVRQRIADLMGWCAQELGRSHIHEKIREHLAIPDGAYPWQTPHPEGSAVSAWDLLGIDAEEPAARSETSAEPCPAVSPVRDIHDAIAAWHDGAGEPEGEELHEYLGMTWEQYKVWVETSQLPEGSRWALPDTTQEG